MSAAFSPDGKRIVTASADKTARLWDAETGKPIGEPLKGHDGDVMSAAFSPDGKRIVTASGTRRRGCGTPRPASPSASRSKAIGCVIARRSAPTASASSPRQCGQDGAAVGRRDRQADRRAAQEAMRVYVNSAAFSPDGKRIVTASADKTARLWDTETGKPIGEPLKGHADVVYQRGVQPRRQAHRHRVSGQDGAAVGHRDRQASRRAAQRP